MWEWSPPQPLPYSNPVKTDPPKKGKLLLMSFKFESTYELGKQGNCGICFILFYFLGKRQSVRLLLFLFEIIVFLSCLLLCLVEEGAEFNGPHKARERSNNTRNHWMTIE